MSQKKIVDLRFPVGGLFTRAGHQSTPPFFSPDLLNVRPIDTLQGRERGGSRPGLGKAYYDQLGSGNPVRMLTALSIIDVDGYKFDSDNFKGSSLGDAWAVASWVGTLPSVTDQFVSVSYSTAVGAVHDAYPNFDVSQAYEAKIFCVPYLGRYWGKYQIFARMDSTTPIATTDGIIAELVMNDAVGTYSGTLKVYSASSLVATHTFTGGATGQPDAGWFSVTITGDNVVCKWLGNTVLASTAVTTSTKPRVGFGAQTTTASGLTLVDTFMCQYKTTGNQQTRRRPIIASSNGVLYRENLLGSLTTVSSSLTLASDREITGVERAQKLYIADNGNPRVTGTAGLTDSAGTLFDDAAVTDWTALGISTNDDLLVVLSGTGATVGNYVISSIHATNGLTLAISAGSSSSGVTYRVERAPKIYDPATATLTKATTTAGILPVGCPLSCRYRDRWVLAGAPNAPHVWYMSAQGDFADWDYAADDTDGGRAVAGTSTDAGTIGEPILALMVHGDDYLIFGCENSLWLLRGDPAYQGSIDNVSRAIGVVGKSAWCHGPGGELVFLSRDGLYMMQPGQGMPVSVSREKMPRELLDIDGSMYTVSLAYSVRERGVHIFLTPNDTKTQKHWFFDWQQKGFWPDTYSGSFEPTAVYAHTSTAAEESAVMLGGRDGYVRRFRNTHEDDDGTTFSTYVYYGPIRLGGSDYSEGMVSELFGALGETGGDVTWGVYVGETHEAAEKSTAFATGTFGTAGMNFKVHPRARGASFFLKLSSAVAERWSVERMGALLRRLGKQRLA